MIMEIVTIEGWRMKIGDYRAGDDRDGEEGQQKLEKNTLVHKSVYLKQHNPILDPAISDHVIMEAVTRGGWRMQKGHDREGGEV